MTFSLYIFNSCLYGFLSVNHILLNGNNEKIHSIGPDFFGSAFL